MNKQGFTLAEILGVIVIVGLLLVVTAPMITDRIKGSEDEATEVTDQIIYNATVQYIDEYENNNPGKYCITIEKLISLGKLVSPVIDIKTGNEINDKTVYAQVYSSGIIEAKLVNTGDCVS